MCGKFTSVDHIFAVCPSFSCHSSQTITEYPKYFVLKKLFLLLHRQIYKKNNYFCNFFVIFASNLQKQLVK